MDGHALSPAADRPPDTATREQAELDQRAAMDRFLAGVECRALRIAEIAVRDRDDALDIVQDAMIRLVRHYARRPQAEWAPLFYRILQNRIRDHQRRAQVRRRIFGWLDRRDDDGDPLPDPMDRAADGPAMEPEHRQRLDGAMQALDSAIAALPERQRQAFLLRALEGLNVADTAAAMGCSAGSVKTHYSRAVHSLRATLGEHWQ
ncbi:MAG: RNA polymerase sigma factor [Gammaproteobacteria bacterium]|nr:MAG: RNA polymerase sigma factor [Gammaproteobacteria bacterium]